MRHRGKSRTCERLEDEEREHHLAEDALEQPAARLVAPLKEVQHCGRWQLGREQCLQQPRAGAP